jgi:hypothetical protein
MALDPQTLLQLSRQELANMARQVGVAAAETLTRSELADELLQRSVPDSDRRRRLRGWFGTARDMLASLVERGLNLPDAAALIRGDGTPGEFRWQPPLATITLAKIYDAQGYRQRALDVLTELLTREPDHPTALRLISEWSPPQHPMAPPPESEIRIPPLPEEAVASSSVATPATAVPSTRPPPRTKETATLQTNGPTSARVTWALDAARLATLGGAHSGQLVLTIAAYCGLPDGTRVTERDIELQGAAGEIEIDALPAGAVLRSRIAWTFAGRTEVLVVPTHAVEPSPATETKTETKTKTAPQPVATSTLAQPSSVQAQ